MSGVCFNLGCGSKYLPRPWINVDLHYPQNVPADIDYLEHDLRFDLPNYGIASGDVEFITSNHFFEHLNLEEALRLLQDCRHRLVKGGKLRIVVPDLEIAARAYVNKDFKHFQPISYAAPNGFIAEYMNYSMIQMGEHRHHYDWDYLHFILKSMGFVNIKRTSHVEGLDCPERIPFSLYVECEK